MYIILFRVAETLYNPFGEDDDDFELNELLNRHFTGDDLETEGIWKSFAFNCTFSEL